jgi:hypothetical protein
VTDDLKTAIDTLYRVFAPYQRPTEIQLCLQCYKTSTMPGPGQDVPLRELEAEELEGLAFDFLVCAGDLDCLRHYLPRLFELVATKRYWLDMEILFKKLADPAHPYTTWPEAEHEAIDAYFAALWRQLIAASVDQQPPSPDEFLCAIDRAGVDPIDYLNTWMQTPGLASLLNFREFLLENNSSALKGKLANAFWERPGEEKVLDWLRDTALLALLMERAETAEQPEEREAIDACFDLVAGLQT